MISGITPTAGSTFTTPAAGKNTLGKDDFLRLLIAQLEAQDPLEPMDAQDFSAQLAQFSTLEQITNANDHLKDIKTFEQALSNSSALGLIGKQVDAPGDVIEFKAGEPATLRYLLGAEAGTVTIDIFDVSGRQVNTLTLGAQSAGGQQAAWAGTDSSGNPVAEGQYTFHVSAEDASGNPVNALTLSQGLVTDVLFENGRAFAKVNGVIVPVNEIIRVAL